MAKPTATDAELILRLYDLRREPELRKAPLLPAASASVAE